MSKVSIIDAVIAAKIQPFVSNEQARYYLNGFHIEAHPDGGAFVVATTGHLLGCFHDESAEVAAEAIIQLPKDFVKACKARSAYPLAVYIEHATGAAYLAGKLAPEELPEDLRTLPGLAIVAPKVIIDGKFPDWRRVMPADGPDSPHHKHAQAWYNAKYLNAFGTVSGTKDAPICVSGDATMPAWVHVSGVHNFVGVLMPMRGGSPCRPPWFNAAPTPEKQAAE